MSKVKTKSKRPVRKQAPIDADKVITDRGSNYGQYKHNAQIAQALKRVMADHARMHNKTFTDSQWESLEMIASKIARIVNGNADHHDSWLDIAGYAQLVADEIDGSYR